MTWPAVSARSKDWGTEILQDSDLESELDILHTYINDMMNSSSGHKHDGSTAEGPKILTANIDDSAGTAGDFFTSSGSGIQRVAIGTFGQVPTVNSGATNLEYTDIVQGAASSFVNLNITRPTAATVTVTADALVLKNDGHSQTAVETSVNETADITSSGANGLDTGTEANSTWYYIWIIRKSSDGTTDSLLSTASTIGSITFPSGYDQAALVGAVFNNSSGNFVDFEQYGLEYWYKSIPPSMASGNVGTSSWISIDTTNFVPSSLSEVIYVALQRSTSTGQLAVTHDNGAANIGQASTGEIRSITGGGTDNEHLVAIDIQTADTIYWQSDDDHEIRCAGFKITKLG